MPLVRSLLPPSVQPGRGQPSPHHCLCCAGPEEGLAGSLLPCEPPAPHSPLPHASRCPTLPPALHPSLPNCVFLGLCLLFHRLDHFYILVLLTQMLGILLALCAAQFWQPQCLCSRKLLAETQGLGRSRPPGPPAGGKSHGPIPLLAARCPAAEGVRPSPLSCSMSAAQSGVLLSCPFSRSMPSARRASCAASPCPCMVWGRNEEKAPLGACLALSP